MQKVKFHDFIELHFIGKVKSTNEIFDLTDEAEARKNKMYDSKHKYVPMVVCVGENQVIPGLDKELVGKEIGRKYTVEISPENAFGKKESRLMKLINVNIFLKQNIQPVVGLPVNIDNLYGIVRSTAGGRVIVDFNHPLAGKELIYEFTPTKLVENDEEKLKCIVNLNLGLETLEIKIKNKIAEITTSIQIPEKVQEMFNKKIESLFPNIKKIIFIKKETSKNKEIKPKSIN